MGARLVGGRGGGGVLDDCRPAHQAASPRRHPVDLDLQAEAQERPDEHDDPEDDDILKGGGDRHGADEVPGDEDFDPAAELADCLARLALAGRRERIDFLIEKQRVKPLDEAEIAELRQLR